MQLGASAFDIPVHASWKKTSNRCKKATFRPKKGKSGHLEQGQIPPVQEMREREITTMGQRYRANVRKFWGNGGLISTVRNRTRPGRILFLPKFILMIRSGAPSYVVLL